MRIKRAAAFICSAVIGLCACTPKSSQETAEIKPAPPFMALNETVEGRNNVYLVVKNLESSYWQVIIKGAKDAGDLYDTNIFYSGSYSESDWQGQERLIQEAIDMDADAMIIAPNDSVMLAEQIADVYDKGIPTILIDTPANTDKYDVCFMTDNLMAGQIAAGEMISSLKRLGISDSEEIQIGIQVGATSSQTINERLAGFIMYWTQNAPDSWGIISDIKCNEGDNELALSTAQDLLDNYPKLRGVFGTNNSSTVGLATILKQNERTDVAIVGFDYSDQIAALVTSDDYCASTVLQQQYLMTSYGVKTALNLINGGKVERKFVDTGVIAVNKENINSSEVVEVLKNN